MSLSALIADFLENLEVSNTSQFTIRDYDHYLKRFMEFTGDIPLTDINLALINKYKQHLSQLELKKITQNYYLIAIRALLRYLTEQNIQTLPSDSVELIKQERSETKELDEDQLKMLLESPVVSLKAGARDKAILETLLSTGYKVSKLVALNRGEVRSNWVDQYLSQRQDSFKPLFIRFQGRKDTTLDGESMRLTPRSIQRIVEKYVKITGLAVKATPQTIRAAAQKKSPV